jgi:hypothetical protein
MISELVTARHLSRKAVVYVRQSHPHQVLGNQESLRLQYALCQRARDLGWQEADVEVVDADLGLSGAAADHRRGFKDLIARVTLGEVGIILSYDVTRLARNCSDWYPLLDLCGFRQCLIARATETVGQLRLLQPRTRTLDGTLHDLFTPLYPAMPANDVQPAPFAAAAQVAPRFLVLSIGVGHTRSAASRQVIGIAEGTPPLL